MRHSRTSLSATAVLLAMVVVPWAAPCRAVGFHTPLAWQQVVGGAHDGIFTGQRKNTTWVRDRNGDFVDDLIDSTFAPSDTIRVILDLNRPMTAREAQARFGHYGTLQYMGRILTTAFLKGVRVGVLDSMAAMPEVAMVEWQVPIHLAVVYSTREIQARANKTFPSYANSAEELGQTGAGVGIAILDDGVDEGHLSIPDEVKGFDAFRFEDVDGDGIDDSCQDGSGCSAPDDEPGDGTTDPDPCTTSGGVTTCHKHGTWVAGIALGRGYDDPTDKCAGPTTPTAEESGLTANCAGTAAGANLIDVRVCPDDDGDCPHDVVSKGLDWLAIKGPDLNVRVANMSFVTCADDDPTGSLPALVDYIAESGIVMVAAHGNRDKCLTANPSCDPLRPNQRSLAPGVAAMALTVSATNDLNSIPRHDDTAYAGLEGPRCGFDPANPQRSYLKPDISAPGDGVWTTKAGTTSGYEPKSGTSLAAPHVAGAAAIVLGANPAMDAASACDLLLRTADPPDVSTPYDSAVDPVWNEKFGMGIVNVAGALAAMNTGDVAFPSCGGDPGQPGAPCLLPSPRHSWENDLDITTDMMPPVAGTATTIHAAVQNKGTSPAVVDVDFGIYILGAGTKAFYHIGRQRVSIAAGITADVTQAWTPADNNHQCIQVAIRFGPDRVFWDNVTQRNLTVAPSGTVNSGSGSDSTSGVSGAPGARLQEDLRVENPFPGRASFRVEAIPSNPEYPCSATPAQFTNDRGADLPQNVHISFRIPRSAQKTADCRVVIYGTPDSRRETEIGGVTLRSQATRTCAVRAVVSDSAGTPLPGVHVSYARAIRPGTSSFESAARRTTSDHSGAFRLKLEGDVPYRIRLRRHSEPSRDYVIAPRCGTGPLQFRYGRNVTVAEHGTP